MPGDEKIKSDGVNEEKTVEEVSVAPVQEEKAPQTQENKSPERGGKGGERKRRGGSFKSQEKKSDSGFVERVIKISRVSKVVKGGKNFSFSALVVTGDGKGSVGIGLGKSNEVVEAIKKGTAQANKSFMKVNVKDDTIPHETIGRFKASRVILKPAGPGTGVIAGGPVRAMCDAAGIKNILTKTLGSRNAVNVVKATEAGFKNLMLKRRGTEE
jgi:small subunit ribosomal protein S5